VALFQIGTMSDGATGNDHSATSPNRIHTGLPVLADIIHHPDSFVAFLTCAPM
jgi:hypothetical protein